LPGNRFTARNLWRSYIDARGDLATVGWFVQVFLGSVRVGSPFIVILNNGCRESHGSTKVVDLVHDRARERLLI
jgi:hypothetical protein